MKCVFDVEGNLLRCEHGRGWFSPHHYHEDKGDKSRDFPMGKLSDSVAEYEHRTGARGTMALIESERAKWMESPERKAFIEARIEVALERTDETGAPDPDTETVERLLADEPSGPNDAPKSTANEVLGGGEKARSGKPAPKPKSPNKATKKKANA